MSRADLTVTLDPDDTAIVFADLQPELVGKSRTNAPEAIEAGAEALARSGEILRVPMIFSVVAVDGKEARHLRALEPYVNAANSLPRTIARPFGDEPFAEALEASGRKTLVIAGYSCEAVVQYLALDGLANGFKVVVAVEACGARSSRAEAAALRRIEQAGATVTSIADILQSAEPDMASERGQKLFGVVHDFMGEDV